MQNFGLSPFSRKGHNELNGDHYVKKYIPGGGWDVLNESLECLEEFVLSLS